MIDLRIVIVNFNTKDKLRECLRSVFASRGRYGFTAWVVDNGSRDGSADMTAVEFPAAKLIKSRENLGYGKANNLAIRKMIAGREKYGFVLLLNPDVKVSEDTFDKMISFMNNDSTVGIAGPRVVKPDGQLDLACRRSFPNPANALFRFLGLSKLFPKSPLASYNLTYLPDDQISEVDSVMGAFLLIRAEVISRIGLLDESFFMYGEDLDWCWRAKAAGYKVMYAPITTVVHDKGSSSRKTSRKALWEFHRSMQLFYDKHYRQKYNFLFNLLVRAGIWARFAVKFLQNALRREKYVSR